MKPRSTMDPSHRFFHAMVLMGSSLALGCGGVTTTGEKGTGGSGGKGNEGGAGGSDEETGSGGIATSSGGTTDVSIPTGGSSAGGVPTTNTGGVPATNTGGTASGGAAMDGGASLTCPMAQWSCSDDGACVGSVSGVALPSSCECHADKPSSDADCKTNELFVCRAAAADHDGNVFESPKSFDCACVPRKEGCTVCNEAYGYGGSSFRCTIPDTQPRDVLCGCAFVYLR